MASVEDGASWMCQRQNEARQARLRMASRLRVRWSIGATDWSFVN